MKVQNVYSNKQIQVTNKCKKVCNVGTSDLSLHNSNIYITRTDYLLWMA